MRNDICPHHMRDLDRSRMQAEQTLKFSSILSIAIPVDQDMNTNFFHHFYDFRTGLSADIVEVLGAIFDLLSVVHSPHDSVDEERWIGLGSRIYMDFKLIPVVESKHVLY